MDDTKLKDKIMNLNGLCMIYDLKQGRFDTKSHYTNMLFVVSTVNEIRIKRNECVMH